MKRVASLLLAAAAAWLVLTGWIAPATDRAMRLETVDGFSRVGKLHTAPDGRLVIAEPGGTADPEGRVVVLDPATDAREILLEGEFQPVAADMAADGTVCAVGEPASSAGTGTAQVRCTDGTTTDLPAPPGTRIFATDLVSDGDASWLVTEIEEPALWRFSAGQVERLVLFEAPAGGLSPLAPTALARADDGTVWVGFRDLGVAAAVDGRWTELNDTQWAGGDFVSALVPRRVGQLVLHSQPGRSAGVGYCCGGHADRIPILEGLSAPRGLALLPDGRIAVSDRGQLLLYRPRLLPGS